MYLERIRLVQYGPFGELDLDLTDDEGDPRRLVVIHGEGGTGKSALIEAMAHTRPGKATPLTPARRRDIETAHAVCDWRLSLENPDRPHPLRVISPNMRFDDSNDLARRREQSQYDRAAVQGPGFVFVEIPSQRYFSPASLGLNDPARMMTRYETRSSSLGYESSRPDLTRPCKQALSYAAISSALNRESGHSRPPADVLGQAMQSAVSAIAELAGYRYVGVDTHSLEPMFETAAGTEMSFDTLPTQLRHLIAFVAIPIRATWAGHSGADPRITECVVAIDDYELYLSPRAMAGLFGVLRRALPRAQWILTTSSPYAAAAADSDALLTLRREPVTDMVSVYTGHMARTH